MTYYKILESYTFSRRFLVQYACACAREVAHLNSDPRVMKAITTAEAWLEGKATQQDCRDAANANAATATAATAVYAAYAAYYSGYAAYHAATAGYAVAAATAASVNATYHAIKCKVKGKDEEYFTKLLLTMIQTHLSSFEREMIGIDF